MLDEKFMLGRFCGSALPRTFMSTGNHMTLRLITDDSVANDGFSAFYTSMDTSQGAEYRHLYIIANHLMALFVLLLELYYYWYIIVIFS